MANLQMEPTRRQCCGIARSWRAAHWAREADKNIVTTLKNKKTVYSQFARYIGPVFKILGCASGVRVRFPPPALISRKFARSEVVACRARLSDGTTDPVLSLFMFDEAARLTHIRVVGRPNDASSRRARTKRRCAACCISLCRSPNSPTQKSVMQIYRAVQRLSDVFSCRGFGVMLPVRGIDRELPIGLLSVGRRVIPKRAVWRQGVIRNHLIVASLLVVGACSSTGLKPGEGQIDVPGGRVLYRIVGSGRATPLLLVHGGPGAPSYYLEKLAALADECPVIFYDQLGCGRSDYPTHPTLWRIQRFVEELRQVRSQLRPDTVHILGHSWGSMLAVDYLLTQPTGVQSVVLAGPALNIPRYIRDVQALRAALPPDVQETLSRHERAGTTDSTEYQEATRVFNKRHLSRLDPWPSELQRTVDGFGGAVYNAMWGPNESLVTGLLKDYDRTSSLSQLRLPVLFTVGRYDEVTPEQAVSYQELIPGARVEVFEQSAHMTMLDEALSGTRLLRQFLREIDAKN